jgi:signal peptidase I
MHRAGLAVLAVLIIFILLLSVGPKFLPYQTYFVRSGSMEPTIGTGDMIVLTETDADDLGVGDVITFERPDKQGTMVTHRIDEVKTGDNGRSFITKGDANSDVDGWEVPATGNGWKYSFRIPNIGYALGYLQTSGARFGLLVVPALILGIWALIDIWRPRPRAATRH